MRGVWVVLSATALALSACHENAAKPPSEAPAAAVDDHSDLSPDPDLGAYMIDAALLGDTLWLVGENGRVITIDLRSGERGRPAIASVTGVERSDGTVFLLAQAESEAPRTNAYRVVAVDRGSLKPLPPARIVARPFGFLATSHALYVLEPSVLHVFSRDSSRWRRLTLTEMYPGHILAVTTRGDALYAGSDSGEWGGLLTRIDLNTGAVSRIQRRDSNNLCAGPLNPSCDPVTGLIADPATPDCVIVSVGLEHGLSRGRILRVCGTQVTPIFRRPYRTQMGEEEEAFHAVTPSSDGFTAFTWEASYDFHGDSRPTRRLLLLARSVGGVRIVEARGALVVQDWSGGTVWTPR